MSDQWQTLRGRYRRPSLNGIVAGMRTIPTAAAVLLLNWHNEAAHAQSPLCLPYEPETVVLTGTVQRALAYPRRRRKRSAR